MARAARYRMVPTIIAAVAVTAVMFGTLAARPAQADCVGPSISSSATTVARGGSVTVTGSAWGTDCNDVNPDPDDSALGAPATGIVIAVVQDDQRTVLAKGNASSDYSFTVALEIPSTLRPGPGTVTASLPATSSAGPMGGVTARPVPLTISDTAPTGETQVSVTSFGPTAPVKPEPHGVARSSESSDSTTTTIWLLGGAAVVVIIGALVVFRKSVAAKLDRGR